MARIDAAQKVRLEKWLEALRSGQWAQTENELWTDSGSGFNHTEVEGHVGYCCLGVLCKLNEIPSYAEGVADGIVIEFTNGTAIHPQKFDELVGLELREVPYIDYDEGDEPVTLEVDAAFEGSFAAELASLNDNGASFEEIADVIEERANRIDPEWRTR